MYKIVSIYVVFRRYLLHLLNKAFTPQSIGVHYLLTFNEKALKHDNVTAAFKNTGLFSLMSLKTFWYET